MGSPISAMALKALLILAALGLVYSENSHCSAFSGANGNDGRDCTCGDKAFEDRIEPVTDDQIHTADFAECKFQCDLFASFGACDWFLFVNSGTDENCHLFGPGKESMDDSSTLGGGICGMASYCPKGCVDCTSSDKCNG